MPGARPVMFDRVLVANRGEIALRIVRTCRDLGIHTIAAHSSEDRHAAFVHLADSAVEVGPAAPAASYLAVDRVVAAARRMGAQAIHPGYGFLSENPALARACADSGIVFVGPPPAALEAMGDKIAARRRMADSGVPVIPGAELDEGVDAAEAAAAVGYPVLVKASAGGGGIGMRVARDPGELEAAVAGARSAASRAFGDGRLFLERFLGAARHVEIQVVADGRGAVVHLGERECSIQRRFQKIIEESPSTAIDAGTRERMGQAAIDAARTVGYVNAGTVEFVVSEGSFYFLEMNARLQVEHPLTELVYGVDLVAEQLRVAAGEQLSWSQHDLRMTGHAIECRVCAEDPAAGFLPSPGRVTAYREPAGPGVRVDSALVGPGSVPASYDPLIAKVITWAPDRDLARSRMRRALLEYGIAGITTNIPYLLAVLDAPDFAAGAYSTRFLDEHPELVEAARAWEEARRPLQRGVGDRARVAAIAAAISIASPS